MKLKGKRAKNFKGNNKTKALNTLKNMEKQRIESNAKLRSNIEEQLNNIQENKKKILELLERYKKEVDTLKIKLYHISGAESVLHKILENK